MKEKLEKELQIKLMTDHFNNIELKDKQKNLNINFNNNRNYVSI